MGRKMKITIDNISKEQDKYLLSIPKGEELWLTEKRLGDTLNKLFPSSKIIHNKRLTISSGFYLQPDYYLPEHNLVIEFQGYHHFSDWRTCYKDAVKRNELDKETIFLIEIPYFIQLDYNNTQALFGKYTSNIQDYSYGFPNGFIHPKAMLPGSFCIFGLEYYEDIKGKLDSVTNQEIELSLSNRSTIEGISEDIINPYIDIFPKRRDKKIK